MRYKAHLELKEAQTALKARADLEKPTEGKVREAEVTNSDRIEAKYDYIAKEGDYQKVENLFRSQQKRVDCIITLANKQRTEIAKAYN